ncbi:MAG TPA: hypothetical protein VGW39_02220 [Chthoniobacterales bacterium]|nr:hypothetical protein [Chthoniobacterales bacterium]
MGTALFDAEDSFPRVIQEFRLVFASDEFGGSVFVDPGNLESAFLAGARSKVDDIAVGEYGRNRTILDPNGDDFF